MLCRLSQSFTQKSAGVIAAVSQWALLDKDRAADVRAMQQTLESMVELRSFLS